MDAILSECSTSITDLKKNPSKVIIDADGAPVAILNHNKPIAYLLPAEAYQSLINRLEDAELAAIATERAEEKKYAVTVSLDEL